MWQNVDKSGLLFHAFRLSLKKLPSPLFFAFSLLSVILTEDHPITSFVLADLFAESVDCDEDLPDDYPVGFLVGYLDAVFRDRKTYPPGWWK
jgi:hypothetical protein